MLSFGSLSIPSLLTRFRAKSDIAVDIRSVKIYDIETLHDTRTKALKHLLKLNHINHAILYHHLQFHNHMPHLLGSAYLLGASGQHLNDIYEEESKELEKWQDSPHEVAKHDWRDYLGDPRYQRAYVDFFEDELALNSYDWRKVLNEYLFQGEEPLISCMIAGLGHPLIHLAYAHELSSRELAMEALGIVATSYSFLHKYFDDPSYSKASNYVSESPLEVLERVAGDHRFDGLFNHEGVSNLDKLFDEHEDLVLEHWNAWHISQPREQFEDSQRAATLLLVATQSQETNTYDFFLVHLLTTSHAVRILLPLIPSRFHVALVRQWWLLTLAVYISQLRPFITQKCLLEYNLAEKDWTWVDKQATEGKWAQDAHFVKALRAMKVAANTWGDQSFFYLKAAVRFADCFNGWAGFGPLGVEAMQ